MLIGPIDSTPIGCRYIPRSQCPSNELVENTRTHVSVPFITSRSRRHLGQIEAEYRAPYLAHAPLEPINARHEVVTTLRGLPLHHSALLKIINAVLDFSKIEAGKLVLETVGFSVHEKLTDVAQLFSAEAKRKNLTISYAVSDSVPNVVRGDPVRLGQILANLVSNAIKFSQDGDISIVCDSVDSGQRAAWPQSAASRRSASDRAPR